jgi:hypothetical protein
MIYTLQRIQPSLKALANVDLYPLSIKSDPVSTLLVEFAAPLKDGAQMDNFVQAMLDLGWELVP